MSKKTGKYSRVTTHSLAEMKQNHEKISMLTAYDYTMAKIIDNGGIDVILVGDSASNISGITESFGGFGFARFPGSQRNIYKLIANISRITNKYYNQMSM